LFGALVGSPDASEGKAGDPLKAGKKAGAGPRIADKMRAALQVVKRQDIKAIEAEPVKKGSCNCGCKKA
jgi:hypothetical protein